MKTVVQYKRKKLVGLTLDESNYILNDTVKNSKRHKDYDRTVMLAKDYRAYITGDGLDAKLKQFAQRESDIMFAQRKTLTKAILPAVASKLMKPAYKISSVTPSINIIDWDGNDKSIDEMRAEVEFNIANYDGANSVDTYMRDYFIAANYIDPNSWTLTTYDAFDSLVEKAAPYPIQVSAEEAINFNKVNNTTQWLISRWPIDYIVPDGDPTKTRTNKGFEYRLWTFDYIVKLVQVDSRYGEGYADGSMWDSVGADGALTKYTKIDKHQVFIRHEVEHNAGFVPGSVNGCRRDVLTEGRTMVNMFHEAVCYFEKTLKVVSEMDITMTLHAFLQKIAYQPRCQGMRKQDGRGRIPCDGGKLPDGSTCGTCNGTGFIVHTTAQDAIYLGIPSDKEDMFDLDKLVKYVDVPIAILEFQDKYIDKIVDSIITSVYNSSTFVKDTIVATATEKQIDYQNIYDTLRPLADGYALQRCIIVRSIATYIDYGDGLIVDYKFPKDLQFKGVNDLLADLKLANESNAPSFMKRAIVTDLAKNIFSDQVGEYQKLQIQDRYNPFTGKSQDEILFIISNKKCPIEDEVLYLNINRVFDMAENSPELQRSGLWFYDLSPDRQDAIIKAVIAEIAEQVEARNVQTVTPDFSV